MKLRKVLIVIMVTLMMLSLTGCNTLAKLVRIGNAALNAAREESTDTADEEAEFEDESESELADESEAESESEKESELVKDIASEITYKDIYDIADGEDIFHVSPKGNVTFQVEAVYDTTYDDEYNEIGDYGYETLEITSDTTPNLKWAIQTWNDEVLKGTCDLIEEIDSYAITDSRDDGLWNEGMCYSMNTNIYVRRADESVFSYLHTTSSYTGGAHGNIVYEGLNFDSQTGEYISIKDAVTDTRVLCEVIEEKFNELYGADEFLYGDDLSSYLLETYFGVLDSENSKLNFLIGHEGIIVVFSPYEIACYATGCVEVTIPYSEYPDLLRSEYFEGASENYMFRYPALISSVDVNNDKRMDTIYSYVILKDGISSDVGVSVNDVEVQQEEIVYTASHYYVRNDGKSYVYIALNEDYSESSVMVFDINGSTPTYVGSFMGTMTTATDPTEIAVRKRIDILSTYEGLKFYHAGDDGLPVADTETYILNPFYSLISVVDLTGDLVSDETFETIGQETVPAGLIFEFIATDNATYIIFRVDSIGLIKYEITTEWPQLINGVDSNECFETLYYAG